MSFLPVYEVLVGNGMTDKTCSMLLTILLKGFIYVFKGEKLSDEEVTNLLQGMEDIQGQVNYEGKCLVSLKGLILGEKTPRQNVNQQILYLLYFLRIQNLTETKTEQQLVTNTSFVIISCKSSKQSFFQLAPDCDS